MASEREDDWSFFQRALRSRTAAEFKALVSTRDEAIRAKERERIATAIEMCRLTPPDDVSGAISAYPQSAWRVLSAMWHLGMDCAATTARGEI